MKSVAPRLLAVSLAAGACGFAAAPSKACSLLTPPSNPPPCNPDINESGVADQKDVAYLTDFVYNGLNPGNYSTARLDFNHDGYVNKDDITDLVNTIAGGPCPSVNDDCDDDGNDNDGDCDYDYNCHDRDHSCGGYWRPHRWRHQWQCNYGPERWRLFWCRIRGDMNGDGRCNGRDVARLARILGYGNTWNGPNADINRDGRVDGTDLIDLMRSLQVR